MFRIIPTGAVSRPHEGLSSSVVEQRFRKAQVVSSSLTSGFIILAALKMRRCA